MIVAVRFTDLPAETPPFVRKWLQRQGVGHRRQTLDLVVIDNDDEIVQFVVSWVKDLTIGAWGDKRDEVKAEKKRAEAEKERAEEEEKRLEWKQKQEEEQEQE